MDEVVNVHDFKTHYSRYLAQVKQGKTVIVGERGKPFGQLTPLPNKNQPRKLGQWKDAGVWIADDFDEPMEDLWEQIANRGSGGKSAA